MYKNYTKKVNNFLPSILINEESKDKLFSYASSHNLSDLEQFITTNSISLEVINNNNQTIMHLLLQGESTIDEKELLRCIKFLVERGAPISSIDNFYLTPLIICIKKNYPLIFKYLLEEGASLDINTYDNLTVLHEIVKPEHITYDATGIQSLIPDKLPKMTMEGYETVYKEILDVIEKKLDDATDTTLKTNFDKFKTIAKQFYYNDDDEREDFNNVLLEEKASDNPSIKDDLFKKLKNQLENFYTSDKIDEVDITDLDTQLTNIADELNKEFKVEKMHEYNDNVLNAIKLIAYSLELSIHYFFNKRLQENKEIMLAINPIQLYLNADLNTDLVNLLDSLNNTFGLLGPNGQTNGAIIGNVLNNSIEVEQTQEIVTLIATLNNIPPVIGGNIILQLTMQDIVTLGKIYDNYNTFTDVNLIAELNNTINIINGVLQNINPQIFGQNLINSLTINPSQSQELTSLIDALNNNNNISRANFVTLTKLFLLNDAVNGSLNSFTDLPDQFKNDTYVRLLNLYKLDNIINPAPVQAPAPAAGAPVQIYYFENNNNIQFNHIIDKNNFNSDFKKYIENNYLLIFYNFYLNTQNYNVDYFNLLHTFNEHARTYIPPQNNIQNPFKLYQNIQQIYKYNYIIYIFEKERKKILNLKNYKHDNFELKKHLDNFFDTTFKQLEDSINLIKQQLEKIKNLSNEYIDVYNKRNGHKIYTPDTNPIFIGIYPKIQFPTEIKYKLSDENDIIDEIRGNYTLYNKQKNDFFHNFVLYFQDIGIYDYNLNIPNALLNNITNTYAIDINDYNQYYNNNNNIFRNEEELNQYNDDNKNKAYKLYFYDPTYLKLEKQSMIEDLLRDGDILSIDITKFDTYKNEIAKKLKDVIKNKILNEILEEKFNNILVLEINNFFKDKLTDNTEELTYEIQIKEPDFNAILIASTGFSNFLIPTYEFKNNKFLSISKNKNKFLKLTLYFDTNYFKINNLKTLKYYKTNDFINEILNNNESLLGKMDNKGWTPVYYAIDGNNYQVINKILESNPNTLIHYDHNKISPLKLCINKQLNHLNYLLIDNEIHYLNIYIKMLKNELQSNNLLIPLNIDAVFIIALFIQNHIWLENAINNELLNKKNLQNTRKTQINKEYIQLSIKKDNDVINDDFNYSSNFDNTMKKNDITYKKVGNEDYNYSDDEINLILKKYYDIAKTLEKEDFGLYGSYWKNYDKNKQILEHIKISNEFKNILKKYKEDEDVNFNVPSYDKSKLKKEIIEKLTPIKEKLERYLKFINIRFNSNKENTYTVYLNKIYVHVLANIIGVHYYLEMEKLILKHYINLNVNIGTNTIKEQLKKLNKLLINNKLDETENINYKYIIAPKNPELTLKKDIIDILNIELIPKNEELIATFETKVFPYYKDLYKITFKYLEMFISNYHKFIYNQYHGLEILLLLLGKLDTISS